jgi:hypothetical protein
MSTVVREVTLEPDHATQLLAIISSLVTKIGHIRKAKD